MNAQPDSDWVKLWLEYAKSDLDVARKLLADESVDPRHGALHIQQAVEKAIKAALITEGIDPPHVHDLERLMDALPSPWKEALAGTVDLGMVSTWAAGARYPREIQPIPRNVAHTALAAAELLIREAEREITSSLDGSGITPTM